MSEDQYRFWNPLDPPFVAALNDWASGEVERAIKNLVNDPPFWFDVQDGEIFLGILDQYKMPDDMDPPTINISKEIVGWADDYKKRNHLSIEDRRDILERISALERLVAAFRDAVAVNYPQIHD